MDGSFSFFGFRLARLILMIAMRMKTIKATDEDTAMAMMVPVLRTEECDSAEGAGGGGGAGTDAVSGTGSLWQVRGRLQGEVCTAAHKREVELM